MTVEFALVLVFSSIFQIVIVHQGISAISKKCYVNKWIELSVYLVYLIIMVIKSLYLGIFWLSIIISIVLIIFVSLMHEMSLVKRLLFPVILSSMFILTESFMGLIVTSLTSMTVEQTQDNIYFYMQGVIGSKLLVFFIILALKQFITSKSMKMSIAMTINMCILPVVVNVILFAISELMVGNTNKRLSILLTSGVIAFLISIIVLMYSIEKNIADKVSKNELEYVNNEMVKQLASVHGLIEKYKFSNMNMHDMKNKLLVLKGMTSNNINYVKEIQEAEDLLNCTKNIVYTGITGLDAILNDKISIITSVGIELTNKILLSDLRIDEMKLAILMANLLDNAIEESERLISVGGNASISFEIIQIDNQIHIRVVNNKRDVVSDKSTSKQNKQKHGYGMQIIDNLTEELNGIISREISRNEHVSMVMIVC